MYPALTSHPLTSRFIRTELDTCSTLVAPPPVGHRSDWSSSDLDRALALAGTGDGAISCCSSCGEDVVVVGAELIVDLTRLLVPSVPLSEAVSDRLVELLLPEVFLEDTMDAMTFNLLPPLPLLVEIEEVVEFCPLSSRSVAHASIVLVAELCL